MAEDFENNLIFMCTFMKVKKQKKSCRFLCRPTINQLMVWGGREEIAKDMAGVTT